MSSNKTPRSETAVCTIPVAKIFSLAQSSEGMSKLKASGIKGRLTLTNLKAANPGVSFAKATEKAIGKTTKASTKSRRAVVIGDDEDEAPVVTRSARKVRKSVTVKTIAQKVKKAAPKTRVANVKTTKVARKVAPKHVVAKQQVPAGYRMMLRAVAGGLNITKTLLVGAFVDVIEALVDNDIAVSTVKGVYVDKKGLVSAHIYVTGKDGAPQTAKATKSYCADVVEVLEADSCEVWDKPMLAEGSKAQNFIVKGVGLDAEDYDTLDASKVSLAQSVSGS